ncbi:MAG: hypothetical protein M1133_05920 [Armatimonadetes bacterium]|nr:hypothetical protein [Armatimonadota bacterium]
MKTLVLIIAAMLVMSVAAVASPIPGSLNEIINGDFETGDWAPWEHGSDLGLDFLSNDPHGWVVSCKQPGGNLLLRQVVDESRNTLWNWTDHAKFIDLTADIMAIGTPPVDSGVRFRLDWWDERYNSSNSVPTDPVSGYSDWVTIMFADIPGYRPDTWVTVNPFNNDGVIFKDFQPRWVSVEIELIQTPLEIVVVDNFILTSRCVPEPMSVMLGVLGLGAVGTFRRIRRK